MQTLESKNISISRTTKGKLPSLPFVRLKDTILGKNYNLSVAFVSPKEAQQINIQSRGKDYVPNVLSFSLEKNEGELIMCLSQIRKETKKYEKRYDDLLLFLVIHGMLHLKGFDHGSTMEGLEEKYIKKFSF